MTQLNTIPLLTLLAMLAFAGNSLLCRLALLHTQIDAASFTLIRIVSGAMTLWLIVRLRDGAGALLGNWPSGLALFAYAAAFSFAYVSLPAAVGALLLFGAVQATMIGYGLWAGERLGAWQTLGFIAASAGLVALLLPGLSAPPLHAAGLMLTAGLAWGIYSLRAKGSGDPTRATAGNFARAAVFALGLSAIMLPWASLDGAGVAYAVASGALTSGLGYAVWYTALRGLRATTAATVQLSVPALAALGGVVFLNEPITLRLLVCSVAILGGVALVIANKQR
jgi:drug/metabolite transporter (DMT)-like permease